MKHKIVVLLAIIITLSFQAVGLSDAVMSKDQTTLMVVVNCDEWVSLRESPYTWADRIAQVPLGAEVEVLSQQGDFSECIYLGTKGFILSSYLRPRNTAEAGDPAPANTTSWIPAFTEDMIVLPNVQEFLTLRAEDGSTIRTIAPGEQMRVLGWSDISCRVEVISTGQVGYVHSGYIKAKNVNGGRWPYDYATLQKDIEALPKRDHISVETLAKTADDRDILVLRYGADDAAHHILIQCAMHAREIMTSRLGGDLIQMLLEDYPDGVEDVCLHIIPLVNPDGQEIALYGAEAIRDARLRSMVQYWLTGMSCSAWKANAKGVDINRNFDAGWESLTGITPGNERYRGEQPHSEVESMALVDYTARYPFDCTISIHSFGSVIYWLGAEGALKERTRSLADAVSNAIGYKPAENETAVEKGGFKDWALEKAQIPSITIEIGALDSVGSLNEYSGIALRFKRFLPALVDWVKDS